MQLHLGTEQGALAAPHHLRASSGPPPGTLSSHERPHRRPPSQTRTNHRFQAPVILSVRGHRGKTITRLLLSVCSYLAQERRPGLPAEGAADPGRSRPSHGPERAQRRNRRPPRAWHQDTADT